MLAAEECYLKSPPFAPGMLMVANGRIEPSSRRPLPTSCSGVWWKRVPRLIQPATLHSTV
jgi:hypothetical protein